MAEFDVNQYFRRAAQSVNPPAEASSVWDGAFLENQPKQSEVADAAARKLASLRQKEKQREQSWAGQLNFDQGGVAANAVNLGASVVSATSEAAGDLAALPANAYLTKQTQDVPDEVMQAYSRYQNNEASERDMALLDQRTPNELALRERDNYTPAAPEENPTVPTYLQTLDSAMSAGETARDIDDATDVRSIVDPTNRQNLSEELRAEGADGIEMLNEASKSYEQGETFAAAKQLAMGLSDLVVDGGAALANNPAAVMEYASELAPDLVMGAVAPPALVARNVGYGLDAYNQGLENYAADNNGELPNREERRWMAANAIGMGLMDTFADTTLLKGIRGAKATRGKKGSVKRTAEASAGGTVTEGVTEGAQTAMEGEATARPASGLDIYEAAVTGAGAGGTVTTAGRAVSEARGTSEEQQQIRQEDLAQEKAEDESIVGRINEGDYDSITDPKNAEQYPPDRVAVALYEDATRENATDEQRQASETALKKMASALDREVRALELETAAIDPKEREGLKKRIASIDTLIKMERDDGNEQGVAEAQAARKSLTDELRKGNEIPQAQRKALQSKLSTLKKAQAIAGRNRVNLKRQNPDVGTEALMARARNQELESSERTTAASDAVNLMMADSQSVTPEQVQSLLAEADDVLSDDQRTYLRSLSDAAVARNAAATLESVDRDVFSNKARDGFKSLPEYQNAVANALDAGDTSAAEEQLNGMREWVRSHKTKATLAQQAVEQTGPGRQMAIWNDPRAEGGWSLQPYAGKAQDRMLRKNGGLSFSTGQKSKELAAAIQTEANAIEATGKELAAAIKIAKSQNSTAEQPQAAPADAQTESEPSPVQETADAPTQTDERTEETEQPEVAAEAEPEAPAAVESGTDAEPAQDSEVRDGDTDDAGTERGSETVSGDGTTDAERTTPDDDSGQSDTVYGLTFEPVSGQLDTQTFKKTNLVAAYFTVQKTGDNQTKRPLSSQEDFVSSVLAPATADIQQADTLSAYVKDLEPAETYTGQRQREFLRQFAEFAQKTHESLKQGPVKRNPDFYYEDFLNYFVDDNGELPENVSTAIAYGAFTWLAENAGAPSVKSEKDVKRMLGLNPNDFLEAEHYEDLRAAGELRANVVQDLGKRARQALGLKLRKDAPQNHGTQLEQALGAYALAELENNQHVELWGKKTDAFPKAKEDDLHYFIKMPRNEDDSLPDANDAVLQGSKNTEGVLSKLFDVEAGEVWPSFEPITEMAQRKAKRTTQDIPSEQKAIVADEMANKAWMIRPDMKKMVDRLKAMAPEQARNLLTRMGGAIDPETYVSQASNELGNQGKREAIEREVDYLLEFYDHSAFTNDAGEKDYSKRFYFPLSVWSNQRVGMASNTIDPLSSKIHRFMLQMPEWEYTIPLSEKGASPEAIERLNQFRLAVMEGLGEPVDKQSNQTSLDAWNDTIMDADGNILDPELRQMVNLALEFVEDTGQQPSAEALNGLADYVAGKEGFHTMDALIHLAQFKMAQTWGDTEMRATLIREGDGITNGPALATILSGAWANLQDGLALVNKMGFFEIGNPYQSAGAWQESAANNDLYQTLAVRVDQLARDMYNREPVDSPIRQQIEGVFGLMGSFTEVNKQGERQVSGKGRKRVKTPLTGMAFGASVSKSIENMGHDVVDVFFEQIEGVLNNGKSRDDQEAEINQLVQKINPLLNTPLKEQTLESAQKLEFTKARRQEVVTNFKETIGATVAQSLEEQFGPTDEPNSFLGFRDRMNKVSKDAFDLFMLTRDYEIRQFIEEERRAGRLPVNNDGEALQDLTGKQLAELDQRIKAINPVVHTAMSKASKQRSAGLHMSKQKQQARQDEAAYWTNVKFRKPMTLNGDQGERKRRGKKNERTTLTSYGQALNYTDPGVRVFITNVHSLDSAIASRTYKDYPALNVHDAEIVAATMMQTVAEQMNQETFKALLDHSLPEEIMTTALQVYTEFQARETQMQADSQFTNELDKRLTRKAKTAVSGLEGVRARLAEGLTVADKAEANKLELLAEIETVNQYGVEGGEYRLTQDDRAAIAEKRKTSVTDRVMKHLARRNNDPALVSEMLSDWRERAENTPAMSREDKDTLSRIQQRYLTHGDLDKALTDVFPARGARQQSAERQQQQWRTRINERLALSLAPSRSIKQSTMPEVLKLISSVQSDRDVPLPIYDAIRSFARYVQDPTNAVAGSLTQVMAEANRGDRALAEQVVGFLDRRFDARRQTPWGTLGRPVAAPEPILVRALENTPRMSAKDLLAKLPPNRLTQALSKLVDPDLQVHYVTRHTPASIKPPVDVTRARGFWDRRNNGEAIYIKSPDFVESNVNPELVTHEVLHSVLYDVVERNDAKSQAFVKEIGTLRAKTIKYLEENGLMESWSQAVVNDHELIAWGMTNKDFQDNVLAKVQMQTQNKGGLKNGLKAFIDAISTLLFGKRNVQGTGLEALLVNTAGLMEQAANRQKVAKSVTLKQEGGPSPQIVNEWSTEQVYDALGNQSLDARTDQRLRSLLDTVVDKVHGPFGAWVAPDGLSNPADVLTEAKATGKLPFASQAQTVFPLNDQQVYVLEQVEASLQTAMAADSLAYKDLVRVFRNARNVIKPADLDSRDPDAAQAKYDMLFDLSQVSGSERTNHLSRFAALAMVEPTVFNALNEPTQALTLEADGMGDQLKNWYDRTTQQLSDQINKTSSTQATNERIQALSETLADIEARNRADAARKHVSTFDQVEAAGKKLGEKARKKISEAARSDTVQNHSSGYVQGIGALTADIADDRVNELLDALEDYRAWNYKQRQGLIGAMITEARGSTDDTRMFHRLLRMASQNERRRKQIDESVSKDVKERMDSFTKTESEAFTRTVLRTDLAGLQTVYGDDGEMVTNLMDSPQALQREITKWEKKVAALGYHEKHYMAYSKLLGYFMATGKARGPHMSLNAYNIARLAGTNEPKLSDQKVADAEKVLDPLISLYALKYTNATDRKLTAELFKREGRKQNESGALYALKLHERMKAEAQKTLFDGDKALFMKGYTREIYNPHREVTVATAEEGKTLVAQGWIQKPKHLVHDKTDPDQTEKFVYVMPHGGLNAQVTGSISYTGTRRKGSALHGGEFMVSEQEIHQQNQDTNRTISSRNWKRVKTTADLGRRIAPEMSQDNYMVPVFNPDGKIVNYRYLMSETNKDELLDRNNRAEDILGSMASHMFDKNSTEVQNRQVIETLKSFHDLDYQRRPEAFINVGPESDDKQARETYHLLPPAAKQAIQDVWGGNTMYVRADVLDMVFGYRKFSLSNMIDKPQMENAVMQEIRDFLVNAITSRFAFGDKAKLRIRQGEDMWQELVKEIKDAWVIKNLTTLLGNISSNVSILVWNGMNPKQIVETHKTAINGLLAYQDDSAKLLRLEREQSLGLSSNPKALEQDILELRDALDRNPVKTLIDEGLFQTILEDVDAEADDYSYKSRLVEKVSDATENLPSAIKTGAKWVYLAHDTPAYKLLFKTTQMSDFVARYSLYQHLTTRAKDKLGHDDAVQRIADTFVNYDIPTHKTLQYLNDTGLVFFTKYYLRIQKVLFNLFQEKPARGLLLALFSNYFTNVPTVMESGPRISNPLDAGALNYPAGVSEILPIKVGLSFW